MQDSDNGEGVTTPRGCLPRQPRDKYEWTRRDKNARQWTLYPAAGPRARGCHALGRPCGHESMNLPGVLVALVFTRLRRSGSTVIPYYKPFKSKRKGSSEGRKTGRPSSESTARSGSHWFFKWYRSRPPRRSRASWPRNSRPLSRNETTPRTTPERQGASTSNSKIQKPRRPRQTTPLDASKYFELFEFEVEAPCRPRLERDSR